jgi:hypothetical protein
MFFWVKSPRGSVGKSQRLEKRAGFIFRVEGGDRTSAPKMKTAHFSKRWLLPTDPRGDLTEKNSLRI